MRGCSSFYKYNVLHVLKYNVLHVLKYNVLHVLLHVLKALIPRKQSKIWRN